MLDLYERCNEVHVYNVEKTLIQIIIVHSVIPSGESCICENTGLPMFTW